MFKKLNKGENKKYRNYRLKFIIIFLSAITIL